MRLLTRQSVEEQAERQEPARLVRMLVAVAIDAGRLDMFDDVFDRWQPDGQRTAGEHEAVGRVRARVAAGVAGRLAELRAYSQAEFATEADDLLEAFGVPMPELGRES